MNPTNKLGKIRKIWIEQARNKHITSTNCSYPQQSQGSEGPFLHRHRFWYPPVFGQNHVENMLHFGENGHVQSNIITEQPCSMLALQQALSKRWDLPPNCGNLNWQIAFLNHRLEWGTDKPNDPILATAGHQRWDFEAANGTEVK